MAWSVVPLSRWCCNIAAAESAASLVSEKNGRPAASTPSSPLALLNLSAGGTSLMLSLYILQVDDTRDWRWSCRRWRGMPSLVQSMWGACNHHHHHYAACCRRWRVCCTINWTQTGGPVPECCSSLTAITLLLPPPLCFWCILHMIFFCVCFGGSWWGTSAGAGAGYRPVYGAISARARHVYAEILCYFT